MDSLTRLALVFVILIAMVGCRPTEAAKSGERIKAVSTIGMIADIVREVGGDKVDSVALMGPGVDPHLYRATAGDVQKLEQAQIIFYGGLELEGRMTDIFVKMASRGTPTHAVTATIPLGELREPPEFAGKHDPHVWFDVTLWRYAVELVRDELIKLSPINNRVFTNNADAYLKKLDALHAEIQTEIAKVPADQRVLITAHDAFGYFGRRYGFEVIGIQGTSTAAEAGASNLRRIADLIATRKIKAVFVESSVPPATIEALRQAVKSRGWEVNLGGELFSDAMGQAGTPEGTYVGMVRHNVQTIVSALK